MSSTGSLKRTDGRGPATALTDGRIGTALAAIILTMLFVSFRPFQLTGDTVLQGGDTVNQLGYGTLGALALMAMATLAGRKVLAVLLSPWWLVMLAFLALAVWHAADPNAAMRAASFTVIGILAMAAVLALPRDADSFCLVLAFAGFTVLALSYGGLVVFPDIAKHTADSLEPEHAGLWRGVFQHKNVAGPVMACFSFAGLYLMRRGWRVSGGLLFVAALIFMANTGSKTTVGLVPLAFGMVVLPGLIGLRSLTPALFALAVIGTALATLGIVFIGPLHTLAGQLAPGMTYTGRTSLWAFGGEMLARRPWTGYGYESFWGTPIVLDSGQAFDSDWDVSGSVHAHNGYLDLAISMGIPALCVAVVTLLVVPARDYLRTPLLKENVYLADFFMMVLLFTALNSFLETFLFRRADPVWMLVVMAVLGLRLVARLPIRGGQRHGRRLAPDRTA